MKIIKYIMLISIVSSFLSAQGLDENLLDRIKGVSADLIEGYSLPLITAFGTGMGSGLFHSAYSHEFMGFDLGVRVMYIQIPSTAKYFSGTAIVCSLDANNDLISYEVELDNISTIFGPDERTYTPTPTGNAHGIPQYMPEGLNLSGIPFGVPQLNFGLPIGFELAVRYLPLSYEGAKLNFLGFGAKLGLNRLPFFKTVTLPFAIAIGGAYQGISFKDSDGATIVSSKTWNLQIVASKRLAVFEPFVGAGLEGTNVNFHYRFEYEIPDTVADIATDVITEVSEVNVSFQGQNHARAMVGFTLYMGPIYLHYDYDFASYKTHNGIIGITFR